MRQFKKMSAGIISIIILLSFSACDTFSKSQMKTGDEKSLSSSVKESGNKTITKEEYNALKNKEKKPKSKDNNDVTSKPAEKSSYINPEVKSTAKEPITKIKSSADLVEFSNTVNSGYSYYDVTVTLENDINLSGVDFKPIGSSNCPFEGKFKGNNHTISNMTINNLSGIEAGREDSMISVGLFGTVLNATITNVKLSNISITLNGGNNGYLVIGGAVGYLSDMSSSDLRNIKTSGKIEANSENDFLWTGGVVGNLDVQSGDFRCKNLLSEVNIHNKCETVYSGGIFGYVDIRDTDRAITLSDFIYKGNIYHSELDYSNTGGISGYIRSESDVTVKNCFVNCNVNCNTDYFITRLGLIGGELSFERSVTIINSFGYFNPSDRFVNFAETGYAFETVNCNFGPIPNNFKPGDQWNLTNRENPDFNF